MKAMVSEKYGSPDNFQLKEVEKPVPKDDEVLIKVNAASVNPFDWHNLRGKPNIFRLSTGLFKPKHQILGYDVSGTVEAIGRNVKRFQPGEDVFGASIFGGFAEYVCAKEKAIAQKPDKVSFEDAASIPMVALTVLQSLRNKGNIKAGQKVLINGASGGLGTFALQIAKHFDTEVTGVCSTRNVDLVYSLGADHVIDYTQEEITKNRNNYNLIYDAVGNLTVSDYKLALGSKGIGVIAGFTNMRHMFGIMIQKPLMSGASGKKIKSMVAVESQEDLEYAMKLIETGEVKAVIDRRYPLAETAEAVRYLETGRARGKVIITIKH